MLTYCTYTWSEFVIFFAHSLSKVKGQEYRWQTLQYLTWYLHIHTDMKLTRKEVREKSVPWRRTKIARCHSDVHMCFYTTAYFKPRFTWLFYKALNLFLYTYRYIQKRKKCKQNFVLFMPILLLLHGQIFYGTNHAVT